MELFTKNKSEFLLFQIEAYTLAISVNFLFLLFFGSYRRHSRITILESALWLVFNLSPSFVTITIGLMNWVTFGNELLLVWIAFILVPLGNTYSITAYSLRDIEDAYINYWSGLFQYFSALIVIIGHRFKVDRYIISIAYYVLWMLGIFGLLEKWAALNNAKMSRRLGSSTKQIFDFMKNERLDGNGWRGPMQMRGCKYIVEGEENVSGAEIHSSIVTVEKVWTVQTPLLSSEANNRGGSLKDLCLSFALHKLIKRRIAGYPITEEKKRKTWEFVKYGLLCKSDGSGHDDNERAFRVIEDELAFLYDFFYTKHAFLYKQVLYSRFIKPLLIVAVCLYTIFSLKNYQTPPNSFNIKFSPNIIADVWVTRIALLCIILVEIYQNVMLMLSNWTKVLIICWHVRHLSWPGGKFMEYFIKRILKASSSPPWARKMHQYSLLESCDPESKSTENKPVQLSGDVKAAILNSLRRLDQLSKGESSLSRNDGASLAWACELEAVSEVILVWHIATSLCVRSTPIHDPAVPNVEGPNNRSVAIQLSNYCAYLVAHDPELLPDIVYDTQSTFDKALTDAKTYQGDTIELREGGDDTQSISIMEKGKILEMELTRSHEETKWKILAEFWAEMVLYISPSDKVILHVERLAKGGEFLTHIWALLFHAGILDRNWRHQLLE